jgi:SAM-dependent methyltransferase
VSSHQVQFDEHYYTTVYRDYSRQNPPAKLNFYRGLLERHLGPDRRPAVLDVGCAFGSFLSAMPKEWDRHGIEVNAFAVERAREKLPEIRFACSTLEESPFRGPFDAITAFDVVEHIPDIERTREAVREMLKPGGIFVFVVPVYDGPLGWVVHALDKDPTHLHKTRRDFWLSWARKSFDVLEWRGAFRYMTPFGKYLHFPTRALRQWSPAIAIVAKRR